jgi:hypothetical protein
MIDNNPVFSENHKEPIKNLYHQAQTLAGQKKV